MVMAQFDESRFNAVDAFFDSGAEIAPSTTKSQNTEGLPPLTAGTSNGKRRQGVGASVSAPKSTTSLGVDSHFSKRILQLGGKRKADDDDSEADDNDVDGGEEEEATEGRTNIGSNANVSSRLPGVSATAKAKELATNQVDKDAKRKKKKGKKERRREKEENTVESQPSHENANSNDAADYSTDKGHVEKRSSELSERPKRVKKRSKQKNIVKDRRLAKPDHLVVGNRNYKGHPITPETRSKLNLPPPKRRTYDHYKEDTLSEEWTSTPMQNNSQDTVESMPLAAEKKSIANKEQPTKKRKKTKSKYKNLL